MPCNCLCAAYLARAPVEEGLSREIKRKDGQLSSLNVTIFACLTRPKTVTDLSQRPVRRVETNCKINL